MSDKTFMYSILVRGQNFTDHFGQRTQGLAAYQLNFLRALCSGIHSDFGSKEVGERFALGAKSNITRQKTMLVEKKLTDERRDGINMADVIFEMWSRREMKNDM